MGVTTITAASGERIGPPALIEYAVEPVGVEMISPSAVYSLTECPPIESSRRITREWSPRKTTTSFNAVPSNRTSSPHITRNRTNARSLTRYPPPTTAAAAAAKSLAPNPAKKPNVPKFTPHNNGALPSNA